MGTHTASFSAKGRARQWPVTSNMSKGPDRLWSLCRMCTSSLAVVLKRVVQSQERSCLLSAAAAGLQAARWCSRPVKEVHRAQCCSNALRMGSPWPRTSRHSQR